MSVEALKYVLATAATATAVTALMSAGKETLSRLLESIFSNPRRTSVIEYRTRGNVKVADDSDDPKIAMDALPEGFTRGPDGEIEITTNIQIPRKKTPYSETVKQTSKAEIVATPYFKLIFISILVITVASGAIDIALAEAWAIPTINQQATFEMFNFAWKAGIGALFGLLGGKVS